MQMQYTTKQAAEALGTSPDTLLRWASLAEEKPYKMFGKGSNFFSHDQLVNIVNRGKAWSQFYGELSNGN